MTILLELILIAVILAALFFVLTNALHDASSVVATFISSGAGKPAQAILLAAVFNFTGALPAEMLLPTQFLQSRLFQPIP